MLLNYINAAEVANNSSIEESSHNDKTRTWERFIAWLETVGIHDDPFLTGFTRTQKVRMVGAFAVSLRRGEHSHPRHTNPLVAGTVSKALSNLAMTFQDNDHADPRHNRDGKTDRFITSILRSFRRHDPKEKAQKAVTPQLLQHLYNRSKTAFATHIANLCNGAFFFACRSCEYSKTTGTRKTKTLTPRNIVFRNKHRTITNRKQFASADSVSITFVAQKNDMHHDTITQHATSNPALCPVHIWSAIVNSVLDLPKSTIDTTINAFWNTDRKRTEYITSSQILSSLRWATQSIGKDTLGYDKDDICCHSIRSGAAMAMYLAQHPIRVPTYTIMLQGRWCSDAFLRYIRKQVKEFSQGVSEAMISKESFNFYTIADSIDDTCLEDPRLPNNPQSFTSSFNGATGPRFTRNHVFE